MCVEERDAHQKEKAQLEYDVAKYETRTLQVLERLETEAQKVSLDYEDKYKSLGKDGKKVSGGCHGDGDKDFVDRCTLNLADAWFVESMIGPFNVVCEC